MNLIEIVKIAKKECHMQYLVGSSLGRCMNDMNYE